MKQLEDTRTADMLGGVPAKRGPKPKNGVAMTGAQRAAARRARLAQQGTRAINVELPEDVLHGLAEYLQFKDMTQDQLIEKLLRTQLLRKR